MRNKRLLRFACVIIIILKALAVTGHNPIHLRWLRALQPERLYQETLKENLLTYDQLVDKQERLDKRIEEPTSREAYKEDVTKLSCFIGVKAITDLTVLTEIRFLNGLLLHNSFPRFLDWCLGRIPFLKQKPTQHC